MILASMDPGTITGDFLTFSDQSSEAFWSTLPQGFGFALIVWLLSVQVSVVYKLVKKG